MDSIDKRRSNSNVIVTIIVVIVVIVMIVMMVMKILTMIRGILITEIWPHLASNTFDRIPLA